LVSGLTLEQDNIPLIRDCIALFAHTRQYGQAVAARHHHLLLRPQIRSSWLGLVVAHHLNGNPTEAIEVYDAYASTIAKDGASGPEKAQILQYVVKLCIDANMLDDGLRRLEAGLQSRVLSPRGEVTQLKGTP
jgi:peptide alpha-N-acetyltransferase